MSLKGFPKDWLAPMQPTNTLMGVADRRPLPTHTEVLPVYLSSARVGMDYQQGKSGSYGN